MPCPCLLWVLAILLALQSEGMRYETGGFLKSEAALMSRFLPVVLSVLFVFPAALAFAQEDPNLAASARTLFEQGVKLADEGHRDEALRSSNRRSTAWPATSSGSPLARASFTTADGLPSNAVTKVVILADGSKLFATDAGVARYTGR